ncbi:MAG: bifunctional nicotinamidase/pyrazinamidase [Verrucomicrobia bacterium]|nr:bifunctional nicotinamidase/pyrazinamidase [Verrucomicrobiota bacterium]
MKTLIITDVQHDFMPGGALGIATANEIVPEINAIIPFFDHVFATLDWHPPHHISFADTHKMKPGERIRVGTGEQILWPVHCVQGTWGAEFADGLHREKIEAVFHKGSDPKVDSYSTFFDQSRRRSTGLADHLKKHNLHNLYFVGLATDYCVLYSVLDALELGFAATVIRDACRAINLDKWDEEKALRAMRDKGAKIIFASELKKRE